MNRGETHGGCIECLKAKSEMSMYDGAVARLGRVMVRRPSERILAELNAAKASRTAATERYFQHFASHEGGGAA